MQIANIFMIISLLVLQLLARANSYIRWKVFHLMRFYKRKMGTTDFLPVAQLYKNVMYIESICNLPKMQICKYITTFLGLPKPKIGWRNHRFHTRSHGCKILYSHHPHFSLWSVSLITRIDDFTLQSIEF